MKPFSQLVLWVSCASKPAHDSCTLGGSPRSNEIPRLDTVSKKVRLCPEPCLFRWQDNSAVDGIVVAGVHVVELTFEPEYFQRTDQSTSLVTRVVRLFSAHLNGADNFICDVGWSFSACQIWTYGKSSVALRSSVFSLRKGPSCDGPLASFGDILDVRLKGKQFGDANWKV